MNIFKNKIEIQYIDRYGIELKDLRDVTWIVPYSNFIKASHVSNASLLDLTYYNAYNEKKHVYIYNVTSSDWSEISLYRK
jgi:hypothetical protein